MRYTLRQLEVFIATCHQQTISRAADSLAMSQSAASAALKDLEQQFDVQLFDRVGKRLQLNELGQSLRPQAEALLEQARSLEQALSAQTSSAQLRVGATMTIGDYLAIDLMARYMEGPEGGLCGLMVANTEEIVRQVLNFDLDVGLIEGEVQSVDLNVQEWREDELVAFCSPDYLLTGAAGIAAKAGAIKQRAALSDQNLCDTPWILREPGSGTRQAFDRGMHGLIPDLNVVLELQHSGAIKQAVQAGLGISCLSRLALEDDFLSAALLPLSIPHRDFTRKLYVITHRHKYRSPGLQRWLSICGLSD